MPARFDNPGDFRGAAAFQGATLANSGQVGGTINNYAGVTPAAVAAPDLQAALAQLARLPVDEVPAPAALPARSWMPLRRNPLFVGRREDLRALASSIRSGAVGAIGQIAAATGLGGIGKTQLAAEFVHRYGQFFAGGVCWLNFAEPASVAGEIARSGGSGGLARSATGSMRCPSRSSWPACWPPGAARCRFCWCSTIARTPSCCSSGGHRMAAAMCC
jgi:hypothetical protein